MPRLDVVYTDTLLDNRNEGKDATIQKVVDDILFDYEREGSLRAVTEHYLLRIWEEASAEGYREGHCSGKQLQSNQD